MVSNLLSRDCYHIIPAQFSLRGLLRCISEGVVMLGFDQKDLKIADGCAGESGDQMSGAVGQLLEESMRVVVLHELRGIQTLIRRHLNRVVVDKHA